MIRLSDNFTLDEFTATRAAFVNTPDRQSLVNICFGVNCILQPLRYFLQCPVHINSGYRSSDVNAFVGGVKNSQHLTGCAADITVADPEKWRLALVWLKNCKLVDQLLTAPTWCHVSWTPFGEPRHDIRQNFYKR